MKDVDVVEVVIYVYVETLATGVATYWRDVWVIGKPAERVQITLDEYTQGIDEQMVNVDMIALHQSHIEVVDGVTLGMTAHIFANAHAVYATLN